MVLLVAAIGLALVLIGPAALTGQPLLMVVGAVVTAAVAVIARTGLNGSTRHNAEEPR